MRKYDEFHPLANFMFYVIVVGFLCFQHNPFFTVTGLIGVVFSNLELNLKIKKKEITGYVILFLLIGMVNPLFQHTGETVLFYLNGKAITKEALIYGYHMALVLVVTLLWCRQLSYVFHEEQIMHLIGRFSQKSALILSMSLKWIPMFRRQAKAIREAQIAMGTYADDTILEKLVSHMRIFGATITWSLEHSIVTADSMKARGYHTHRRSFYSQYSFRKKDLWVCVSTVLGGLLLMMEKMRGIGKVYYYPVFILKGCSAEFVLNLVGFLLIMLLPTIIRLLGSFQRIENTSVMKNNRV